MFPTPSLLIQAIQSHDPLLLKKALQNTASTTQYVLAMEKCILEQKMDLACDMVASPSVYWSLEDMGLMLDVCLKHMNASQFVHSPLMDAFVHRLGQQEAQTQSQQTEKFIETIHRLAGPAIMHHLLTHPSWQHHHTPRQGRTFVAYTTPLRPPSFDQMHSQRASVPEPPPALVHQTFAQVQDTLTPEEMVKVWTEFTRRHQHVSLLLQQKISGFALLSMERWLQGWDQKDASWKERFFERWSEVDHAEKLWLEDQMPGWKERVDRAALMKHVDASSLPPSSGVRKL